MRVLIVDDQDPFRDAARAVVDRAKDFEVIGEAASGEEAIATVDADPPDLILMDINMGGISGIDATRAITEAHPAVTVFLLSTYSVSDLPADVNTCGAAAYLNKEEFGGRVLRTTWEAGGQDGWRPRVLTT
ncbi:MAG: response regulator transcription factor [Acidimicrobiales bacterium]|nr:response regulator transcription factor [Acidimicrobiales bacterium]